MKRKITLDLNEPVAHGKKLSHWLGRMDVAASDAEHELAEAAIRNVGQLAVPWLLEGLRRGGRDAQRAARAFRILGPDAISAVPEIQSNPGPEPAFAALALAGIGGPAMDALKKFLTDDEPLVRSAGAEGLSQALSDNALTSTQAQEALPQLVKNARDPHPLVRARSASAIGRICAQPALCVPALIENLNDHADLVRVSAARAIGTFGMHARAALPSLLELAQSKDGPTRCASVDAIAKLGISEGYPTVVAALDDEDILVRIAAVNGLGCFPQQAAEVVPLLVRALEEDSKTLRWNALWALGRLGPLAKDALPAIRKWEERPEAVGREATLRKAIEQIEGREPSKASKRS